MVSLNFYGKYDTGSSHVFLVDSTFGGMLRPSPPIIRTYENSDVVPGNADIYRALVFVQMILENKEWEDIM